MAFRRFVTSVALLCSIIVVMTGATVARATTIINPGFDLFLTAAGSEFDFSAVPNPQMVEFEGNPLGSFDFGSGAVGVGQTDTIVERLALGDLGGGNDTINIEIVALSLISIAPVDVFGAGFEDLFITLNTSSPSVQSTMTIFDIGEGSPHGTFDSILNFSFDVTGSVGGFYATIEKTFTSNGNDWQHASTGGPLLNGVNRLLNSVDESTDFWASGLIQHDTGLNTHIVVSPEPGTAILLALGLAGLGWRGRSKHS